MVNVSPERHLYADVVYWRQRAEEARVMADTFSDGDAKKAMLGIAQTYDFLADNAERHIAPDQSKIEKVKATARRARARRDNR